MSAFRSPGAARVIAALTLAALALVATTAFAYAPPPSLSDSASVAPFLSLRIEPLNPCTGDSVTLAVTDSCGPCLTPMGITQLGADDVHATFRLEPPAACAASPCMPKWMSVNLGPRPAGANRVVVTVVVQVPADSMNAVTGFSFRKAIAFDVSDTCKVTPPLPLGGLPFVEHVAIGSSTAPCDTCPPHVCASQPVDVHFSGHVPNSCYVFRGVHFLPTTIAPFDRPVVLLDFAMACNEACAMHGQEFTGGFTLPPGLAGPHSFDLLVAVNSCPDTLRSVVAHQVFPFVADSCVVTPPVGCVMPFLVPLPRMGPLSDGCNLRLNQGGTGIQSFAVQSDIIPLAGLQGVVRVGPGLHLLGLTPVGPAAGMHLITRATGADAVSYVLYADAGAPIPGPFYDAVLDVRVKADSTLRVGSRSLVSGTVTAASDSTGSSLRLCTIDTFAPVVAQVCIEPAATCDANGDGVTNVADLVRMARCWLRPASCPDTTASRPDCDNDGVFGVADIFCCARTILGGGAHDSTHAAPGLSLAFGAPTLEQGLVHVALEVHGASAMNGALLRVRFPADRYAYVPPVDVSSASGQWLPLTEPGDGDVVIGVLRLDDAAPDAITVPLVFRLLDGQSPGGALTADQGQVIAPDGSSIAVDLGRMTTSLPTTAPPATFTRVELLCGPNPASGSTRFVVRLPQGAPVDLGIFDVAGRRVETLYRGSLVSGETAFTWQPRAAHAGLYFARLAVNGVVRTTRVTMQLAR